MGKPKKGECRELMREIRECNQALNESLRLNEGKRSVELARKMLEASEKVCTLVEDRYLSPDEIRAMEEAAEAEEALLEEDEDEVEEEDEDNEGDDEELYD